VVCAFFEHIQRVFGDGALPPQTGIDTRCKRRCRCSPQPKMASNLLCYSLLALNFVHRSMLVAAEGGLTSVVRRVVFAFEIGPNAPFTVCKRLRCQSDCSAFFHRSRAQFVPVVFCSIFAPGRTINGKRGGSSVTMLPFTLSLQCLLICRIVNHCHLPLSHRPFGRSLS
jgi:hypothetical protein